MNATRTHQSLKRGLRMIEVIAAIGLASVFLAKVANELGAEAPLLAGILIGTLFHALNLVLGAFSPTIQALRLHYVEFFGKFYEYILNDGNGKGEAEGFPTFKDGHRQALICEKIFESQKKEVWEDVD